MAGPCEVRRCHGSNLGNRLARCPLCTMRKVSPRHTCRNGEQQVWGSLHRSVASIVPWAGQTSFLCGWSKDHCRGQWVPKV